ncbi:phosphate acyltransferase [Amphritea balenae]|uniref:Phosphate butyryltransferase n=1 Tax=Amphritea balenae TaxID=452629 RepID=A0A3P1SW12_9GAMM|nr:phosphate acyltransferase [Amphritea balenae]RRD01300.1 phosphate butyryltransferase [Amphritea balenae]GGK58357.1 phosphate butyryltransferase [Amphritea balenae]
MIRTFQELKQAALSTAPASVAVASAEKKEVLQSIDLARKEGLIDRAILTGDADKIAQLADQLQIDCSGFEIQNATDYSEAAELAVRAVSSGDADILIKGGLDSSFYFKAILNRDWGLRQSKVLSNITVFEQPSYHKLLTITDNAILLNPDLEQKRSIIENTRPLFRALGLTPAKVGVVCAIEKENPAMPATVDAAALQAENQSGAFPDFVIEGPFGYDACISAESANKKGITDSVVSGDADLLLMPNMEAANILGKAYKFHGGADSGGLVLGAAAPVVLNSRSDSAIRRLNSMMLAKLIAAEK